MLEEYFITDSHLSRYLIGDNIVLKMLHALIWIVCIFLSSPIIITVLTILIFIDLLKIVMELIMEEEFDDNNLFILYLQYITFYMTRKIYFEQFVKNNKKTVLFTAFAIDIVLLPFELFILFVLILLSPILLLFIVVLITCKYTIRKTNKISIDINKNNHSNYVFNI